MSGVKTESDKNINLSSVFSLPLVTRSCPVPNRLMLFVFPQREAFRDTLVLIFGSAHRLLDILHTEWIRAESSITMWKPINKFSTAGWAIHKRPRHLVPNKTKKES